jgi:hypothetical protein
LLFWLIATHWFKQLLWNLCKHTVSVKSWPGAIALRHTQQSATGRDGASWSAVGVGPGTGIGRLSVAWVGIVVPEEEALAGILAFRLTFCFLLAATTTVSSPIL